MTEAYTALWWIPRGHVPTTQEAEERVLYLREFGPAPYSFTLKGHFPPPRRGLVRAAAQPGRVDLPGLTRVPRPIRPRWPGLPL